VVNDPSSDAHRFEVTTPPAHAMTNIRASDGAVRVCIDPAAPASDDQMTVMVTDTRHTGRALSVVIPIHIQDGTPAAMCDLDAFPPESGGCCDAGGHPGGALPLAIGVLALVRRRRRSAAIPR